MLYISTRNIDKKSAPGRRRAAATAPRLIDNLIGNTRVTFIYAYMYVRAHTW